MLETSDSSQLYKYTDDGMQFNETSQYLVRKKSDSDVMLSKSVLQQHHVFCIGGIVLEHSNHLTLIEDCLQVYL